MIRLIHLLQLLEKMTLRLLPSQWRLNFLLKVSQWRRNIIGPYGYAVLTKSYNGLILVSTSDFVVGWKLAFLGSYNQKNIEYLLTQLTPKSRVLVVGTHVGSLLIPLAKNVELVTGIEANPDTFEFLQLNLKLNNLDNAQIYNFAAGDKQGQIEFYKNTHNSGGSKIKKGTLVADFIYDSPQVILVPMKVLDEELADQNFDMIIMDIEGSEYFAMQGMNNLLEKCQILQLEICPRHIREVARVSNDEFIKPLIKHFNFASIGQKIYPKQQFMDLINSIEINEDVIFKK